MVNLYTVLYNRVLHSTVHCTYFSFVPEIYAYENRAMYRSLHDCRMYVFQVYSSFHDCSLYVFQVYNSFHDCSSYVFQVYISFHDCSLYVFQVYSSLHDCSLYVFQVWDMASEQQHFTHICKPKCNDGFHRFA